MNITLKRSMFFLVLFLNLILFFSISGYAHSIPTDYCLDSITVSDDNRNIFSLKSNDLHLNTSTTGYFNYPYAKTYFLFDSSERQFIKLNYSGPMSKLKIYNYYYYNSNDYLFYSSQISYDQDIIYCDAFQIYVLEFESNTYNTGSFTLLPQKVTSTNLTTHEKYFMHIEYDTSSTFGYRYDVEYKNLDLNNTTSTTEFINLDGGVTSYLDLISNTLNFGLSNDSRRLVSNPGELQYSAIACANMSCQYVDSSNSVIYSSGGTGTFVDETTVLSCAHLFYNQIDNSADDHNGYTAIPRNAYFYPGANSYYNSSYWYQNYGMYDGTDTYLPISYVLYDIPNISNNNEAFTKRAGFDWSITLTENVIEGTYTHSYMKMYHFTSNIHYQAQSAGYPALVNCPTNDIGKYDHTMWASYPLFNTVNTSSVSNNVLTSTDIISTPGNSGGPVYVYITTVYNGQVLRFSSIMGILDANNTNGSIFNYSYICRMRPVIINLYREVI